MYKIELKRRLLDLQTFLQGGLSEDLKSWIKEDLNKKVKILYSVEGTIDLIIEGKSEDQCDQIFRSKLQDLKDQVTQIDHTEIYKTIEGS
tara:strand:+ start:121 stop:390 length:270 start_codon:yes stop_codon:yes gene_type:complete